MYKMACAESDHSAAASASVIPSCSSTESLYDSSEGEESFQEVTIENESGGTEIILKPRPEHILRPPEVHSPLIKFVGGHAHMCQDCFRSLSEAPSTLWITGDTVCVCVCHCLLPPPPTASSRCL